MWWHPLLRVDLYVIGKVVVLQESPLYLCAVVKVKMNSTIHKPTMLRTGQRTLPIFFTARSQDMLDSRLWWRPLTTTYFPPSRFVVWENATFSLLKKNHWTEFMFVFSRLHGTKRIGSLFIRNAGLAICQFHQRCFQIMSGIEVCFLRRSHQRQPRSHICSEGKQTANGAAGDIN